MNLFEKLEKSGVNIPDFIDKHKLLECLPDIADRLSKDIQSDYSKAGLYKKDIKYNINPVLKSIEKYSSYFWNIVCRKNEKAAEQYGKISDELLDRLITEFLKEKDLLR